MATTKKKSKHNQKGTFIMFLRINVVFGAVVILALCLIGRIIEINVDYGDTYSKKVLSQQSYESNDIAARRGDILDRNGNKLATSKKVYNLIFDPQLILSDTSFFEPTAQALYKVLGIKETKFQKILDKNENSRYYVVKKYKGLSVETKEEFEALAEENSKIKGVWFEEEYVRQYPYDTVGSTVIGFCSSDKVGIWGLESQYNSVLTGTPGKKYGYYDSDLNLVQSVKEAVNGNSVITTLDVNVQGVLEQHMAKFQKETGSENMGVIIMNPQNGEIYAMASSPGFDLNNPSDLKGLYKKSEIEKMTEEEKMVALNELWRNFCISDNYEPGSTFKPITVAAALDEGIANSKSTYLCDGAQQVGGSRIKCVAYSKGGHGTIDVCQALMQSCNDALMQMGASLGGKTFLNYVSAFGFGQKTGIDLPGEAVGSVFNKDTLGSTELATSSFGQSQTVTMSQMVSAFSATINGGNIYQPHLMKQIESASGAVVETAKNTLIRKVITEKTSKQIRKYLYKTVDEGTAAPAKVKGYKIGGKTGTAEKLPRHEKNYLVSFIGFTPVDVPQVVIYTVIDQPHVDDQAHSTFATQFSSEVMEDVLPLLGQFSNTKETGNPDITLPSTQNGNPIPEVPEGGISDEEYPVAGQDQDDDQGQEETPQPEQTSSQEAQQSPEPTPEQ